MSAMSPAISHHADRPGELPLSEYPTSTAPARRTRSNWLTINRAEEWLVRPLQQVAGEASADTVAPRDGDLRVGLAAQQVECEPAVPACGEIIRHRTPTRSRDDPSVPPAGSRPAKSSAERRVGSAEAAASGGEVAY
jgi:hypothetical protein